MKTMESYTQHAYMDQDYLTSQTSDWKFVNLIHVSPVKLVLTFETLIKHTT
jgi:hypothetical protein